MLDFLKHPQLVKGSRVGYDKLELKKTSTSELKNISNIIILYFTKSKIQILKIYILELKENYN